MRTAGLFYVSVAALGLLGIVVAVAATLGEMQIALAVGGLALAAAAAAFLLADGRSRIEAELTRENADKVMAAAREAAASARESELTARRALGAVRRVEKIVDATQRRLVAAVESARVEAADRHRDLMNAR